jgi:hypothetical protein
LTENAAAGQKGRPKPNSCEISGLGTAMNILIFRDRCDILLEMSPICVVVAEQEYTGLYGKSKVVYLMHELSRQKFT